MQLQMIAVSSDRREIYEKLIGELSRVKQKGKPRFLKMMKALALNIVL